MEYSNGQNAEMAHQMHDVQMVPQTAYDRLFQADISLGDKTENELFLSQKDRDLLDD
jgi:hypothetical protein